jgi:hypothetical protein
MRWSSALLGMLACAGCTSLNDGAHDRLFGSVEVGGASSGSSGGAGNSQAGGKTSCDDPSCAAGCGGGAACPSMTVEHGPPCSAAEKECTGLCVVPSVENGCRSASCDPCPVPENGMAACFGDVCGIECDPGFVEQGDGCVAPPASCADHSRNGSETDIDCGGNCPRCDAGKTCGLGADCISAACVNASCATVSCVNGVQDSMETDIDCGGQGCPPCSLGLRCRIDGDCIDGTCVDEECRASTCTDRVRNGNEVGTDCGGDCPPCPSNETCKADADCASGHCVGGHCRVECGSVSTADGCPICAGIYSSCCRSDNFCGCSLAGVCSL